MQSGRLHQLFSLFKAKIPSKIITVVPSLHLLNISIVHYIRMTNTLHRKKYQLPVIIERANWITFQKVLTNQKHIRSKQKDLHLLPVKEVVCDVLVSPI